MAGLLFVRPAQPAYAVAADGETLFVPKPMTIVERLRLRVLRELDGVRHVRSLLKKDHPGYYPPDARFVFIDGWLFTSSEPGVVYGAGWEVDVPNNELVVRDDRPGSYFVQHHEERGIAIKVEIPDDWTKGAP